VIAGGGVRVEVKLEMLIPAKLLKVQLMTLPDFL